MGKTTTEYKSEPLRLRETVLTIAAPGSSLCLPSPGTQVPPHDRLFPYFSGRVIIEIPIILIFARKTSFFHPRSSEKILTNFPVCCTILQYGCKDASGNVPIRVFASFPFENRPDFGMIPFFGGQAMGNCAIVGINWGDEGKGRMVDLLTEKYDVVVRYQGGGNAGHTVINEYGKFALHLLPSGIFRKGVVNVLGNGVALDPENLWKEMCEITGKGVPLTPENLKISDRASLLMPWHRDLDGLEEARLADKKFGSTKQGIAPFYADKFSKKTILAGELLYPEHLKAHLADLLEWKNLTLTRVYGAEPVTMAQLEVWLNDYCEKIKPYVCDTGIFLRDAQAAGKNILFEAQLGALRDLDYGIHPYTTSSNPIAAYAPVGSGMPNVKIDEVVGVVKAYSSCVGEGPFTCEMFGEEAHALREAGFEYGAKTGRPRRVGPIDIVATRYGVRCQGATSIALTKMDVMGYMDKIPVCARYEVNGEKTDEFPFPVLLADAKPVIEYLEGWKCDISGIRRWEDLPEAARKYVEYVEEKIGCPIRFVSVGPERDSMIYR